jgi:hypothetical protein
MIEMRIVLIGDGCRPEFQYRFVLFTADASGSLCPPDPDNMWSEWKTAPYVNLMETEND